MFPPVGESKIRSPDLKIRGFEQEMRRNVFSQRVVNLCKSLNRQWKQSFFEYLRQR